MFVSSEESITIGSTKHGIPDTPHDNGIAVISHRYLGSTGKHYSNSGYGGHINPTLVLDE